MLLQKRIWCIHFYRNSVIVRMKDAWPEIGYDKSGIYEVISVGRCTVRKLRNVRSIPHCEVSPGRGGCRKFEPPAPREPVFEYNSAARLWMRYLGPLGDPKAEAEAARIEGDEA